MLELLLRDENVEESDGLGLDDVRHRFLQTIDDANKYKDPFVVYPDGDAGMAYAHVMNLFEDDYAREKAAPIVQTHQGELIGLTIVYEQDPEDDDEEVDAFRSDFRGAELRLADQRVPTPGHDYGEIIRASLGAKAMAGAIRRFSDDDGFAGSIFQVPEDAENWGMNEKFPSVEHVSTRGPGLDDARIAGSFFPGYVNAKVPRAITWNPDDAQEPRTLRRFSDDDGFTGKIWPKSYAVAAEEAHERGTALYDVAGYAGARWAVSEDVTIAGRPGQLPDDAEDASTRQREALDDGGNVDMRWLVFDLEPRLLRLEPDENVYGTSRGVIYDGTEEAVRPMIDSGATLENEGRLVTNVDNPLVPNSIDDAREIVGLAAHDEDAGKTGAFRSDFRGADARKMVGVPVIDTVRGVRLKVAKDAYERGGRFSDDDAEEAITGRRNVLEEAEEAIEYGWRKEGAIKNVGERESYAGGAAIADWRLQNPEYAEEAGMYGALNSRWIELDLGSADSMHGKRVVVIDRDDAVNEADVLGRVAGLEGDDLTDAARRVWKVPEDAALQGGARVRNPGPAEEVDERGERFSGDDAAAAYWPGPADDPKILLVPPHGWLLDDIFFEKSGYFSSETPQDAHSGMGFKDYEMQAESSGIFPVVKHGHRVQSPDDVEFFRVARVWKPDGDGNVDVLRQGLGVSEEIVIEHGRFFGLSDLDVGRLILTPFDSADIVMGRRVRNSLEGDKKVDELMAVRQALSGAEGIRDADTDRNVPGQLSDGAANEGAYGRSLVISEKEIGLRGGGGLEPATDANRDGLGPDLDGVIVMGRCGGKALKDAEEEAAANVADSGGIGKGMRIVSLEGAKVARAIIPDPDDAALEAGAHGQGLDDAAAAYWPGPADDPKILLVPPHGWLLDDSENAGARVAVPEDDKNANKQGRILDDAGNADWLGIRNFDATIREGVARGWILDVGVEHVCMPGPVLDDAGNVDWRLQNPEGAGKSALLHDDLTDVARRGRFSDGTEEVDENLPTFEAADYFRGLMSYQDPGDARLLRLEPDESVYGTSRGVIYDGTEEAGARGNDLDDDGKKGTFVRNFDDALKQAAELFWGGDNAEKKGANGQDIGEATNAAPPLVTLEVDDIIQNTPDKPDKPDQPDKVDGPFIINIPEMHLVDTDVVLTSDGTRHVGINMDETFLKPNLATIYSKYVDVLLWPTNMAESILENSRKNPYLKAVEIADDNGLFSESDASSGLYDSYMDAIYSH